MAQEEKLESGLLRAGIKVTVTDEHPSNMYPPGSVGYSSFIKTPTLHQSLYKQLIYIVRRGKTGKERLEAKTFLLPVYLINNEKYSEILKQTGNYLIFRPEEPVVTNLTSLNTLEFLAWAGAYVAYLRNLVRYVDYSPTVWPKDKELNNFLHICEHYKADAPEWLEVYGSNTSKLLLIKKIRSFEAELYRCGLKYMAGIRLTQKKAADWLLPLVKSKIIPLKQTPIRKAIEEIKTLMETA